MTPSEVLRDAAKLVRRGWTQGVLARDASGKICDFEANKAVCWCASGAIHRVIHANTQSVISRHAMRDTVFGLVRKVTENPLLPSWNDDFKRTQSEVVAALESAAQLSERSGG